MLTGGSCALGCCEFGCCEFCAKLLTASVKLFLKLPSRGEALVTRVLKLCTENSDDPDLRDRGKFSVFFAACFRRALVPAPNKHSCVNMIPGFIYWRLLSTNPEATRTVVLRPKPPISSAAFQMDPQLLDTYGALSLSVIRYAF